MRTSARKKGELFIQTHRGPIDAPLHATILRGGDAEAARDVSRRMLHAKGWSDADIATLFGRSRPTRPTRDYEEQKHPRDPHGQWTETGEKSRPLSTNAQRLTSTSIIAEAPEIKLRSRKVIDVAKELNDRAGEILKQELGVDHIDGPSEEGDAFVSDVIAQELKDGLTNGHSSSTWYSSKIKETMQIAGKMHPEILHDKGKNFAFRCALAITSQGQTPDDNARMTDVVYNRFVKDGRFPEDLPAPDPAITINFQKMNKLIADHGLEGTELFFNAKTTVKELLKQTGTKVASTNMNEQVYGSAVLGPKIGNGFYQNLSGNFEPVTVDMWFMRAWGRVTNTGLREPNMGPLFERLQNALRGAGQGVPDNINALYARAKEITAVHERAWAVHRRGAGPKPVKHELQHAAERIVLSYGGQMVEQPRSGGQRAWIARVFRRAVAKVNADGIPMTNAEAQATWWTPEKHLYDRMGAPVREVDTDYVKSFGKLAAEKGIT